MNKLAKLLTPILSISAIAIPSICLSGCTTSLNFNGIKIKTPATKTTYKVGDIIDLEGLVLTISYNNGKTNTITCPSQSVTTNFGTRPFEQKHVGEQTVTVTYHEIINVHEHMISTNFIITVEAE